MAKPKPTTETLSLFPLLDSTQRACLDCRRPLSRKSKGHSVRCQSCAARARYVQRHGHPPEIRMGHCEVCNKECIDYASNQKKSKHNIMLCSKECRAIWTGIHNSITHGGDGIPRTKQEKDQIYYRKNSDHIRKHQLALYELKREQILTARQQKDRALKAEVIEAYGGECACCGEKHLEFLTIDHTDGSGAEHRRQMGKGRKIYADLKSQGFPKDRYRCLCLNCNIALGFYGYCPHQPDARRWVDHRAKNPGRPRTVA